MNHQKLTPWVDLVQELPLSVRGAMMREHLDCRDEYQRGLFCLRESSLPLLTPTRVFSSVNTSGSPFSCADQCPQALLYRLRGGGVQGVHQQLPLTRASIPSLSNHAVQMGIDKGKGDGHLYASYRPVPLTSPIPRSESRVAQRLTNITLEAYLRYTPEVFSYREHLRPAFMAVTFRAAVVSSLSHNRTCCFADWDESNAYLMVIRADAEQLYSLLQPAWNGGSWCEQYFGRLHIHPLTTDGFAPAFTPDEGFNQGDNYSGEGYQASCMPVSGVLPAGDSIRLPPTPDGMPVNNLVFMTDACCHDRWAHCPRRRVCRSH